MAIEPTQQFDSIMSGNYSKCPGCNKGYITESSPISGVDNETQVCDNCSAGEAYRASVKDADTSLKTTGSVGELVDSFNTAKSVHKEKSESADADYLYEKRVKSGNVPIPDPTTVGTWKISYSKNGTTGSTEATAEDTHPKSAGANHDAILDHETGKVSFGHRGTPTPPKHVQSHITRVLSKLHKEHIAPKQ